jgi:hypothetical protein
MTGKAFALLVKGFALLAQGFGPTSKRIGVSGESCRVPAGGFGEAPINQGLTPKSIGE